MTAKRDGFRALLQDSVLFAAGPLAAKLGGVLVLPLVARSLTTAEMGRLDVLSTLWSALVSLALFGMDYAATKSYASPEAGGPDAGSTASAEARRHLFPTWLAFAVGVTGSMGLVLVVGAPALGSFFIGSTTARGAFTALAITVVLNAVMLVALTAMRNVGQARAFAAVSVGVVVVNAGAIVALVRDTPTATTVLTANAISIGVGAAAAVFVVRGVVIGRPDRATLGRLTHLGWPLVPAVAATWVSEVLVRTVLLGRAGPSEAGFLSVAFRFGSLAILAVSGFQLAWQPRAFARGTTPEALVRLSRDAQRIVVVIAVTVGVTAAASPALLEVIGGDRYLPATGAVGATLLWALGFGLVTVASMPAALVERSKDIAVAQVAAAVVALGAALVLSRPYGAVGAGLAMAAGQVVAAGLVTVRTRPHLAVDFGWARLGLWIMAASATVIVCTMRSGGAPLPVRAATVAVLLVLVGTTAALRGLHRPDP